MIKQFINSAVKWIPQSGFSVTYTENGGIEASQDIVIKNADLKQGSALITFQRGATWESIFPEVPQIYRFLKLKTFDPTDRGDGYSILKCTFTGFQTAASGSQANDGEDGQSTSALVGSLNPEPLSNHPKWQTLSADEKFGLGLLINGEAVASLDRTKIGKYNEDTGVFTPWQNATTQLDIVLQEDAIMFAKIIAEGETTYDKAAWTYMYNTQASEGFTSAQLSRLGKIVANPPGNPVKPNAGWTWLLTSPNQTQSGDSLFTKSLEFRLIQKNEKNDFLYEG
jgi:hypothetical protein